MTIQDLALCGKSFFRIGDIEYYDYLGYIVVVIWQGNMAKEIR